MTEKLLAYLKNIDWKDAGALLTALGSLPAIRWVLGHKERRAKAREDAEDSSWGNNVKLQQILVSELRSELRRMRREREEAEDRIQTERAAANLREQKILDQLGAVRAENGELRTRMAALEADMKRLYRIETRCEELDAENRALREKDRAREAEMLALRARVRELEAAA